MIDSVGWTIIHYAVAYGPTETIQFLLESRQKLGFNLEARTNNGSTILHLACQNRDDIEIIDLVFRALEEINSGIDFETRDNDERTPIHSACMKRKPDVAIELLQRYPQMINVLGFNGKHMLHY